MNKDTKDFLKAVGLVVAGFILIPTLVIVVGWWMVFLCKLLGV